jgi:hypothetical protein
MISDTVACEIDAAVAALCNKNPRAGEAVVRFYMMRWPEYRAASKMRSGERRWSGYCGRECRRCLKSWKGNRLCWYPTGANEKVTATPIVRCK